MHQKPDVKENAATWSLLPLLDNATQKRMKIKDHVQNISVNEVESFTIADWRVTNLDLGVFEEEMQTWLEWTFFFENSHSSHWELQVPSFGFHFK